MAEYIDRQRLKNHYAWWNNDNSKVIDQIVDAQPAADVVPHIRGEWRLIEKGPSYTHYATCSVCGVRQMLECMNYCPHCGADMGVALDDG